MVDLSDEYAVDESDVEPGAELRGANLSNAALAEAVDRSGRVRVDADGA
jgi:hypothetical protein